MQSTSVDQGIKTNIILQPGSRCNSSSIFYKIIMLCHDSLVSAHSFCFQAPSQSVSFSSCPQGAEKELPCHHVKQRRQHTQNLGNSGQNWLVGRQRGVAFRARPRNKVAAMRPPRVGKQEGADLNEVLLDLKGQLLSGPLPYNGFPLPGWAGIKGQLQIPSTAFLINCTHKCKENGSCFSFQDRKSPRTWRYKNKVVLHWLNHHKHYERPTVGPNQDFDQRIH